MIRTAENIGRTGSEAATYEAVDGWRHGVGPERALFTEREWAAGVTRAAKNPEDFAALAAEDWSEAEAAAWVAGWIRTHPEHWTPEMHFLFSQVRRLRPRPLQGGDAPPPLPDEPIARMSYSTGAGFIDLRDESVIAAGVTLQSRSWEVQGPGGAVVASSEEATPRIHLPVGTYRVVLEITDSLGRTARTAAEGVAVGSVPTAPTARYAVTVGAGSLACTDQTLSDTGVASWLWELLDADGAEVRTSTVQHPTFAGLDAGDYSVALTPTGRNGLVGDRLVQGPYTVAAPSESPLVTYPTDPTGAMDLIAKIIGPLPKITPAYYAERLEDLPDHQGEHIPWPYFDWFLGAYGRYNAMYAPRKPFPSPVTKLTGTISASKSAPYKVYGVGTKFLSEIGRGNYIMALPVGSPINKEYAAGRCVVSSVESDTELTLVSPADGVPTHNAGPADTPWTDQDIAGWEAYISLRGTGFNLAWDRAGQWPDSTSFYDAGLMMYSMYFRLRETDPAEAAIWLEGARVVTDNHWFNRCYGSGYENDNYNTVPRSVHLISQVIRALDEDAEAGVRGASHKWRAIRNYVTTYGFNWVFRYDGYGASQQDYLAGATRDVGFVTSFGALAYMCLPDEYHGYGGVKYTDGAERREYFLREFLESLTGHGPDVEKSWMRRVQTSPKSNVGGLWLYSTGSEQGPGTQPMMASILGRGHYYWYLALEGRADRAGEREELRQAVIDVAEGIYRFGWAAYRNMPVMKDRGELLTPGGELKSRTVAYVVNDMRHENERLWSTGTVSLAAGSAAAVGEGNTQFLTDGGHEPTQPVQFIKQLQGTFRVGAGGFKTGIALTAGQTSVTIPGAFAAGDYVGALLTVRAGTAGDAPILLRTRITGQTSGDTIQVSDPWPHTGAYRVEWSGSVRVVASGSVDLTTELVAGERVLIFTTSSLKNSLCVLREVQPDQVVLSAPWAGPSETATEMRRLNLLLAPGRVHFAPHIATPDHQVKAGQKVIAVYGASFHADHVGKRVQLARQVAGKRVVFHDTTCARVVDADHIELSVAAPAEVDGWYDVTVDGSLVIRGEGTDFLSRYQAGGWIYLLYTDEGGQPRVAEERITDVVDDQTLHVAAQTSKTARPGRAGYFQHSDQPWGDHIIASATESRLTLAQPVAAPAGNQGPITGGGWIVSRKLSGGGHYVLRKNLIFDMMDKRQPTTMASQAMWMAYKVTGDQKYIDWGDEMMGSLFGKAIPVPGYEKGIGPHTDGHTWLTVANRVQGAENPLVHDWKSINQTYHGTFQHMAVRIGG